MDNYFGLSLNVGRYQFIQEALDGIGGFQTGGHLVKFGRESKVKYEARQALAYYVNNLKPACNRFVGYLSKRPPQREVNHPLIEAFEADCDWKGNSLDIFLANFFTVAKAKGCGLLLVEMPNFQPANLEQQLTTRFFPYLVSLPVESIRSYQLNPQGQLDEISISTTMMIEGKLEYVVRSWDKNSWQVTMNGEVIQGADHGLGVCPVLPFSEGDTFPYIGEFAQIADIGKRLYNLRSELDEIIRGQTFSILTYQIPIEQQGQVDAGALSEAVGTNNMLIYSGNQAPSFASPSAGPADTITKTIAELENKIKEIGLNVDLSTRTESGIALTIRFQALNAALAAFARKGEDLERRMFDLASRWLKVQNTTSVSYSKTYEIADVTAEMLNLASYSANGFPAEVINAKRKQIVNLDFSNMEEADIQPLLDSIDASEAETSVLESRVALLESAKNNSGTTDNTNPQDQMMPNNMGAM